VSTVVTNVWTLLYDEEATQKAQNVIAAAFGADKDPTVLVQELSLVTEWLMPLKPDGDVDSDEAARRTLCFMSALTMLGRRAIDAFATMAESAKLGSTEDELWPKPEPEKVRNAAFELLGMYADGLREIAGET